MRPKVAVFQIGARRHYAVARGLASQDALDAVYVDAVGHALPWRWFQSLPNPPGPVKSILQRRIDNVEPTKVHSHFRFVLENILRQWIHHNRPASDNWATQNRRFCQYAMSRFSRDSSSLYAYNGAALEIFQRAKQLGKRCVLDQTAAPWRWNTQLLNHEQSHWPNWEMNPGDLDISGAITAREEQEWHLADRIICGSDFVVEKIREVNGPVDKCRVVPYPSPNLTESTVPAAPDNHIHILYLGTLQLRKGIQYLVQAMQQLESARFSCRAVGPTCLTEKAHAAIRDSGIDRVGAVARAEVASHYRWADVFVLPTLSEGSANVCHEAIRFGVPVITTTAAGLSTSNPLVTFVPPADSTALAEAIRQSTKRSGQANVSTIPQRSVVDYGRDLVEAIFG